MSRFALRRMRRETDKGRGRIEERKERGGEEAGPKRPLVLEAFGSAIRMAVQFFLMLPDEVKEIVYLLLRPTDENDMRLALRLVRQYLSVWAERGHIYTKLIHENGFKGKRKLAKLLSESVISQFVDETRMVLEERRPEQYITFYFTPGGTAPIPHRFLIEMMGGPLWISDFPLAGRMTSVVTIPSVPPEATYYLRNALEWSMEDLPEIVDGGYRILVIDDHPWVAGGLEGINRWLLEPLVVLPKVASLNVEVFSNIVGTSSPFYKTGVGTYAYQFSKLSSREPHKIPTEACRLFEGAMSRGCRLLKRSGKGNWEPKSRLLVVALGPSYEGEQSVRKALISTIVEYTDRIGRKLDYRAEYVPIRGWPGISVLAIFDIDQEALVHEIEWRARSFLPEEQVRELLIQVRGEV